MGEWKSIESAPRDVPVMLFIPGESSDYKSTTDRPVCYWDEYYAPGGRGHSGGDGWVVMHSDELHLHYSSKPTHWMPLPAPPTDIK
jgi:hypothetical protein